VNPAAEPSLAAGAAGLLLAVAGAMAIALSACVFGDAVRRRLGLAAGGAARWGLAVALGLGILAQGLFVLGLAGGLRRGPILALLLAGHLLCRGVWRRSIEGWRRGGRPARRTGLAVAAGASIAAPCIVLALYPTTAFDATVYHLPYVQAFLDAGRLVFVPELRFPVFPQVAELLWLLGFVLGGEASAQLLQLLPLAASTALIAAWGERLISPAAGRAAAALWLGTPLVAWLGSSAYVELELALFVAAAFYCWQRGMEAATGRRRRWRWLALCGVFAGLAAGSKYLGLVFCALFAVLALAAWRRRREARPLLLVAVAAGVTLAPWYLRIAWYTGNPVFPFAESIFGSSGDYSLRHARLLAAPAAGTAAWLRHLAGELALLLRLPYAALFERHLFGYQPPLSPWYLVLIPLGIPFALRHRRARRLLLIALAYALLWLAWPRQPRFLLPVLPLVNLALAAGAGGALDAVCRRRPASGRRLHALALLLLVAPGWLYAAAQVARRGPLPLTPPARHAYLAAQVPGYDLIRRLNEEHGTHYAVYALYGARLRYYAAGRFYGDWMGPHRFALVEAVLADGRALAARLRGFGACYFLARRNVPLPSDDAFRRLFRHIQEDEEYILYATTDPACTQLFLRPVIPDRRAPEGEGVAGLFGG